MGHIRGIYPLTTAMQHGAFRATCDDKINACGFVFSARRLDDSLQFAY